MRPQLLELRAASSGRQFRKPGLEKEHMRVGALQGIPSFRVRQGRRGQLLVLDLLLHTKKALLQLCRFLGSFAQ